MAAFVDYDPMTGVQTWADGDEWNRLQVHYRQDVEPLLDLAGIERNERHHDNLKGLSLYARIPLVVIMELRTKYGVDIFKRDHLKRAFDLINQEYPRLKTTDRVHRMAN